MMPTLGHYLVMGAVLFVAGVATMLLRRHALGMLMGMEMMLMGAAVNFVAFQGYGLGAPGLPLYAARPWSPEGGVMALFIILMAGAQGVLGVGIVLNYFRAGGSVDAEKTRGRARANELEPQTDTDRHRRTTGS